MKVRLYKETKVEEPIVAIHYKKMDASIESLIRFAKVQDIYFTGEENGRLHRIQAREFFYVEAVDQKVFIYTSDKVFRTSLKLYQLLAQLKELEFRQISKSCILNMNVLDTIQTLKNSRLETVLSNGEHLYVSRTYIPRIKEFFGLWEGKNDS